MALDYTKIFTILGKVISGVNSFNGIPSTVTTLRDDLEGELETQDLLRLYDSARSGYDSLSGFSEAWIRGLITIASEVLTDDELVLENLPATNSTSVQQVLYHMYRTMDGSDDTGLATATTTTTSNMFVDDLLDTDGNTTGHVMSYAVLDGAVPTIDGGVVIPDYAGKLSQLYTPATYTVKCTSAPSDGGEIFKVFGQGVETGPYQAGQGAETPGTSTTIPVARAQNVLGDTTKYNWDFSNWSSTNTAEATPDRWQMTGAAGTDYELAPGAGFRNGNAILIETSTAELRLKVDPEDLVRYRQYMLTARVKGPGTSSGSVTWTMELQDGSGNTLSGGSKAIADPASPAWDFVSLNLPVYVDGGDNLNDVYVHITNNTSGPDWYLDEVMLVPLFYFHGIGWAILRGETDRAISVDDEVTRAYSHSTTGVIQDFFRKAYRVQLPTGKGTSIADSLAT